jgi:glycolate oxidase FAD binding subunit
MEILTPGTAEELAHALSECNQAGRTMQLGGEFSKNAMGGPIAPPDVTISTRVMKSVLQYEPNDLTISVQAGMRFSDLGHLLAKNRQMIPLDPAFLDKATVGGVIASNSSGPRRRLYGTARDMVIGMTFATVEGKLVKSGGMVVKNVAGLDMGKLMIVSFGTLAAITSVNFKLAPMPPVTGTFVRHFGTCDEAFEVRDAILSGVLQPAALDLLNPYAAARIGLGGWCLLLQVSGNARVVERYAAELGDAGSVDDDLMARVREFTPDFLREHDDGAVVRISSTLGGLREIMQTLRVPAVARAGNGVCYTYYEEAGEAVIPGGKGAIEFAPNARKASMNLWPAPGTDFSMMQKIKKMFDPRNLLNPRRLYGHI